MEFQSINPYNGKLIGTFEEYTFQQTQVILDKANQAFQLWKSSTFAERSQKMMNLAELLHKNSVIYAHCITQEMGKPIVESKAEINKCIWVCEYYAQNAQSFLEDTTAQTDAWQSYVTHEPLGCILAIMPWNFPFWQVFRFAAPALMAGNVALLKHAPNTLGCARLIEDLFREAGFSEGIFQNLILHHNKMEKVIENPVVKAVTLTGSERAGASVAAIAGKNIKKTVLELGGSNAFIVLEDADIDHAVEVAIRARMRNAGQSCIAAKRLLILKKVYDEFLTKFIAGVQKLIIGDPLLESTQMGPLARKDLADQIHKQVQKSKKMGAEILLGGKQNHTFYEPTVLTKVSPQMPVFQEETFGPVAPIIKVTDADEAFNLAEQTKFGLGLSVFTRDIEKAKTYISKVSDAAFFINELVKSDPRLPFGGTKHSGYGRELSKDGILEFVNKKTVYING